MGPDHDAINETTEEDRKNHDNLADRPEDRFRDQNNLRSSRDTTHVDEPNPARQSQTE